MPENSLGSERIDTGAKVARTLGGWTVATGELLTMLTVHGPDWCKPVSRRTGDRLAEELVEGLLPEWVKWRI